MAKQQGAAGLLGGPPTDILGEIWDGERWTFQPQEDFDIPNVFIKGWVEEIVQERSGDPYETPSLNWVPALQQLPSLADRIEHGWSALAVRLRMTAELLGLSANVAQENHRNTAGDLLRVEYVFQVKEKS